MKIFEYKSKYSSIFPLLKKTKIILGRDFASNQYVVTGYALKDGEWEKDLVEPTI